jgi:hypothetical protein
MLEPQDHLMGHIKGSVKPWAALAKALDTTGQIAAAVRHDLPKTHPAPFLLLQVWAITSPLLRSSTSRATTTTS